MAKRIKLNNDNYLGTESIMHNRTRLDNLLCGAELHGGDDITLTNSSAWQLLKCKIPHFNTSNVNVFEFNDGGIKVKQNGWYLVYSTVNVDIPSGTGSGFFWIDNQIGIINDSYQNGGMNSFPSPVELKYINSGSTIYAGCRLRDVGSFLCRTSRSCLTVIRLS